MPVPIERALSSTYELQKWPQSVQASESRLTTARHIVTLSPTLYNRFQYKAFTLISCRNLESPLGGAGLKMVCGGCLQRLYPLMSETKIHWPIRPLWGGSSLWQYKHQKKSDSYNLKLQFSSHCINTLLPCLLYLLDNISGFILAVSNLCEIK